jgi:hypothetical protein
MLALSERTALLDIGLMREKPDFLELAAAAAQFYDDDELLDDVARISCRSVKAEQIRAIDVKLLARDPLTIAKPGGAGATAAQPRSPAPRSPSSNLGISMKPNGCSPSLRHRHCGANGPGARGVGERSARIEQHQRELRRREEGSARSPRSSRARADAGTSQRESLEQRIHLATLCATWRRSLPPIHTCGGDIGAR